MSRLIHPSELVQRARGRRRLRPCLRLRALLLTALVIVGSAGANVATASARTFTGVSTIAGGAGYVLTSDSGETYAFGGVQYRDNPRGFSGRIVAISATDDGQGYAAISSAGQVYAYGSVQYRGNPPGFSGEIVGVSVTSDGQGYVAISSAGQVYAYGSVRYRGNPSGFSGRIVGVSVTSDGQGYVAISGAGQVYAYGTARYRGNPSGFSGQIVGVSVTSDGQGYVAISSAGEVYAYGTAQYRDNPRGFSGQIAGIDLTPDGQGYVAVSSAGQAYAYGSVRYGGNGDPGPPPPATPVPAPQTGPCSSTPGAGTAVTRWRPVVTCVLGMLGVAATPENEKNVFIIIAAESGGNPRAINRTDINARRGDPSRGLMQTIGATFNAHSSRLLPNDIYDPAANIYAGLHYGIKRYRSIANIPGVKSVNRGGPYKPYQDTGQVSLAACARVAAKGLVFSPRVHGMTCAQARRVVRTFAAMPRALKLTRGRNAVARTVRLRTPSGLFTCRVTRYAVADRARLNDASTNVNCRSRTRQVIWTAGNASRRR